MRARIIVGLAATAVVLVSGCSIQRPPPAALTDTEIAVFEKAHNDGLWEAANLPSDTPRPQVEIVRFLTLDDSDWGYVMVQCLKEQGFTDYVADSGGGMRFVGSTDPFSNDRKLAQYICQTKYPYDPLDFQLLSRMQREYLYDYWVRWLVPCLELRGYDVGKAPSRADFVADPFEVHGWNPYIDVIFPTDPATMTRLSTECPSTPAGLYPVKTN
jgi:hypothetical protein